MTLPESVENHAVCFDEQMTRLNLVNLINRKSEAKLTVVRMPGDVAGIDYEIHVTTRFGWRYEERNRPTLPRMPRLLSIVESLRGTRGVPYEIDLESLDGVAVYIPTNKGLSSIPLSPLEAVSYLNNLLDSTLSHFVATVEEVEGYFWRIAKQHNFSEAIVEKMARKEKGFDSHALLCRFEKLLRSFFSVKFRVHTAESLFSWEEQQ